MAGNYGLTNSYLSAGADAAYNGHSSRVYYRFYLEDLTISGRTYAQVEALDKAVFDAAFAAGGRYNGDTWTSPTTLP